MTSAVDICNMALSAIGERANIVGISPPDGSVNADHCARFYPQALREVVEAADWGFATKRAALAPVANTIASYEFSYALPADHVATSRVLQPDSPDEHPGHPYLTEGGLLYCDVEQAVLRYRYVPSVSAFSAHFVTAVSYRLAALLAGPITKSAKTSMAMMDLYLKALSVAAGLESNGSRNSPLERGTWRPSWLAVRRR
jgi:hypothetical protein